MATHCAIQYALQCAFAIRIHTLYNTLHHTLYKYVYISEGLNGYTIGPARRIAQPNETRYNPVVQSELALHGGSAVNPVNHQSTGTNSNN